MARVQKYGNMSPNQHFPHAIQVPSHSQTLHHVANDPLSHHLLGKKTKTKNTVVWSPPLAHPKEVMEEESWKERGFAQGC